MQTVETTATEVWLHAADHGDKPVIHGAELDYDDVHDGVHYHADLLEQERKRRMDLWEKRARAADNMAFYVSASEARRQDPRESEPFGEHLAEWRRLNAMVDESIARSDALKAKRDQDAAFATYEVTA